MKLTILGSGTLYPKHTAGSAGHLLEVGGKHMLFDAGLGTLHKLDKLGIDVRDINHIFFSHTHNDHTCEFAPLLWYLQFGAKKRPDEPENRGIMLNVYGPKGFKQYFDDLWTRILGRTEPPAFNIKVTELESDTVNIDGIKVNSEPVIHIGIAIGYRVEHQGKVFTYSGDTDMCDGLKKLADKADLLLVECGFPKSSGCEAGHMDTEKCGTVAKELGVKKMVLTHLYPEALAVDAASEAKEFFEGEVIKAEDLMEIDI